MHWMRYPRAGTSFGDGRWMVTVEVGTTRTTEILELENGEWFRSVTEKLTPREHVIAIAYVPEPFQ